MKEIIHQLSEISKLYDHKGGELLLKTLSNKHREQLLSYNQTIKNLNAELAQCLRQNDLLESESVHLRHSCKRLEDSFGSLARMRLPQAKNLVRLEEEIFAIEDEIQHKKVEIEEKEDLLKTGLRPSVDTLFLELAKGFEIDFVDKGEMRVTIKNRKRNDVLNIDIVDETNILAISNKLWDSI